MTSPWAASYTTSPLRDANAMSSRSQVLRNTPVPVIPNRTPLRTPPAGTRLDPRPSTPYPPNSMSSRPQMLHNTPAPVIPNRTPLRTPPTGTRLDPRASTPYLPNSMSSRSRVLRNTPAPVIPDRSPLRTALAGTRLDSRPSTPYPQSRRPTTETPHSTWNQWHNSPVYPQQSAPRSYHLPHQALHPTGETQLHHHSRSKSPQSTSRRKRCNSVHIHLSWPQPGDLSTRAPEVRLLNPRTFDMGTSSSSFSHSVSSGSFPSAETPGIRHERPRRWRDDFNFKSGLAPVLRNTINTSRASYGVVDSAKLVLHPLLHYNKSRRIAIYDLRREPETLFLRESDRSLLANDTDRSVTRPPTKSMRIYHPRLPWYIDIKADAAPCISLEDFFLQLFVALNKPISKHDFYNNELDDQDRRTLNHAFHHRCRSQEEKMQGVKRVDFLLEKFEWIGLTPGKDGMWRLKTG